MFPLTWKFNSKQLLSKTLNSRVNIIEARAVLNIVITENGLQNFYENRLFSKMISIKAMAVRTLNIDIKYSS